VRGKTGADVSKLVAHGAALKCSCGSAPSSLGVLPDGKTNSEHQATATIQDNEANVNVKPFGLCQSLANPQVAAATAAAQGALTPQPCLPVTVAPWSPGSATVRLGSKAVLTDDSTCSCQWGGVIEITAPGQQRGSVG